MRKLVLALLLTAAACTAAPGPQNSSVPAPAGWSQSVADAGGKIDHNWWAHFADPTLDNLMREALANNKTLAMAKARIEEARANRAATRAQLLPNIYATGNATRNNLGANGLGTTLGIAELDGNASWELDLFGANQARASAASAIVQSEEANTHAITVSLLAEVARNYFDMRNDERQIAIAQKNLADEQKTYDLTKAQFEGAMASDFDVQRAGAQVSTTAAQIPMLKAAYAAAQNRLNVLMGYAPGTKNALLATPENVAPVDPHVVVAAPAAVLANRPDVRAAERQFAASIANLRAADRDLFPKINLLGLYGYQSSNLLNVAHPWSIAANLTQPILDFGRLESAIDVADAQQKEAFANYQQTVLSALEDMENALTNYLQETERNNSLRRAFEQDHRAEQLAHLQYQDGEIALLDVLVAEQNALTAESTLAASDAALRKDLVAIYAAAGGGWDAGAVTPAPQQTTVISSETPPAKTEISAAKGDAAAPPAQAVVAPTAPADSKPRVSTPHVSTHGQSVVIE